MSEQGKSILQRLRKPSVVLSIASQVAAILVVFGLQIDRDAFMTVVVLGCSILTTLGVLSNPDSTKRGYGDDILTCSKSGRKERHALINGEYVCVNCGAIYDPAADAALKNA